MWLNFSLEARIRVGRAMQLALVPVLSFLKFKIISFPLSNLPKLRIRSHSSKAYIVSATSTQTSSVIVILHRIFRIFDPFINYVSALNSEATVILYF